MDHKKWSLQIGGRLLEIETGLLAEQANGAVTVRYGDTVVLAAAVMSKDAVRGKGYFPLMVDYEERYYAAGKQGIKIYQARGGAIGRSDSNRLGRGSTIRCFLTDDEK
jgi:hypothetical protein